LFYKYRTNRMKKNPENAVKFCCDICDFVCSKKSNFEKHILTLKHKNRTKLNDLEQKNAEKCHIYNCKNCNKSYNARNSLWYHEKKCIVNTKNNTENNTENNSDNNSDNTNYEPTDKELIMLLIKENSQLRKEHTDIKELIVEIVKNGTHNTINNTTTNTNSHNKSFNLQFFFK